MMNWKLIKYFHVYEWPLANNDYLAEIISLESRDIRILHFVNAQCKYKIFLKYPHNFKFVIKSIKPSTTHHNKLPSHNLPKRPMLCSRRHVSKANQENVPNEKLRTCEEAQTGGGVQQVINGQIGKCMKFLVGRSI